MRPPEGEGEEEDKGALRLHEGAKVEVRHRTTPLPKVSSCGTPLCTHGNPRQVQGGVPHRRRGLLALVKSRRRVLPEEQYGAAYSSQDTTRSMARFSWEAGLSASSGHPLRHGRSEDARILTM